MIKKVTLSESNKRVIMMTSGVGFLVLVLVLLSLFSQETPILEKFVKKQSREQKFSSDVTKSVIGDNPKALQKTFLADVKSGRNDKMVKAAGYFITHRYFDSKGNVYEIYDYSHSDPALSFLTKAEAEYPEIFSKIKAGTLDHHFTEEGNLAYLAYLEVLVSEGYGDIAALGTGANQYAKYGYISEKTSGYKISKKAKESIEKSLFFAERASPLAREIVKDGQKIDLFYPDSLVIGLNQYAFALRYYKVMGIPFVSEVSPEEIFAFTTSYAPKNAPIFAIFTYYINTVSLVVAGATDKEVSAAVAPFLEQANRVKVPKAYSVVDRVLKARTEVEKEGVYSKENVVGVALKSVEFKAWLLANGWVESDFVSSKK